MNRAPVIRLDLDAEQLKELAQSLVPMLAQPLTEAMLPHLSNGLSVQAYSIPGWAEATGFSDGFIRAEITAGRLRAVRPGGCEKVRILPEDGQLWLRGQRTDGDAPAIGFAPTLSERNRMRRLKRA
jgi:hypothetical protein